jgi:hypothetical protein
MATLNKKVTIIDGITGEIVINDLVGKELQEIESEQNRLKLEFDAAKAQAIEDQISRSNLLERLGITAKEAVLLLK